MQIINIILLVFTILFQNIACAKTYMGNFSSESKEYGELKILGNASLNDVKLKSLDITGGLTFNNLACTGEVSVVGHIEDSKNGNFKSLIVTGPVNLSDSNIGIISIVGITKLKNLKSETINITGAIEMDNAIINGNSMIIGRIISRDSQFADITIVTDKSTLDNSVAKNIKILKDSTDPKKIQKLILKNNTRILGNIEFESGNGQIIQDDKVKITGKIIGIKAKECNCHK